MRKRFDGKIQIEITGRQCSIILQSLINYLSENESGKLSAEKRNATKFIDAYEQYGNEIKELITKFELAYQA